MLLVKVINLGLNLVKINGSHFVFKARKIVCLKWIQCYIYIMRSYFSLSPEVDAWGKFKEITLD